MIQPIITTMALAMILIYLRKKWINDRVKYRTRLTLQYACCW